MLSDFVKVVLGNVVDVMTAAVEADSADSLRAASAVAELVSCAVVSETELC